MFGYVRPAKGELKVKHYEYYKAAYCGLCNTLQRRHGFLARFVVNYDFTFLAVLLSALEKDPGFEFKRCPASPLNKKCAVCRTDIYDIVADECIVLYYHKLRDSINDEHLLKSVGARVSGFFLRRAYKKARAQVPEFDSEVVQKLSSLSELESAKSPSLDDTADCFAQILSATVAFYEEETLRRPLELLLYHLGRFIYLADARDDLQDDIENGSYNPIAQRFDLSSPKLTKSDEEYLETTVRHSINLCASAVSLLPLKTGLELVENVVYLGLTDVWQQVVAGKFNAEEGFHRVARVNNDAQHL